MYFRKSTLTSSLTDDGKKANLTRLPDFARQCCQQVPVCFGICRQNTIGICSCPQAGYMSMCNGHRRTLYVVLKTHGITSAAAA